MGIRLTTTFGIYGVTTALLLVCYLPPEAHGQSSYYQCEDERGQTVFSQRPCSNKAQARELQVQQKISSADAAPSPSVSTTAKRQGEMPPEASSSSWDKVTASNRKRDIDREIERREDRIKSLQRSRDREIAELNEKQSRAANNYAGAQWETALATEMGAVNSRYDAKVTSEYRELDRLEDELEELEKILVK